MEEEEGREGGEGGDGLISKVECSLMEQLHH